MIRTKLILEKSNMKQINVYHESDIQVISISQEDGYSIEEAECVGYRAHVIDDVLKKYDLPYLDINCNVFAVYYSPTLSATHNIIRLYGKDKFTIYESWDDNGEVKCIFQSNHGHLRPSKIVREL